MGSIALEEVVSESLFNGQTGNTYQLIEEPSRATRKIRIIVIGCGAELVCYDKNPSIGGTWYENKYPGCGCDIPSVNYQFSWAPSAHWASL